MNTKEKARMIAALIEESRREAAASEGSHHSTSAMPPPTEQPQIEITGPCEATAGDDEPPAKKKRTEESFVIQGQLVPADPEGLKYSRGKSTVLGKSVMEEETALRVDAQGDDSTRHPHPEMSMFHTASLQSQSLDFTGAERLVDTLVDFLGAERVLGGTDSAAGSASVRRASLDGEVGNGITLTSALRENEVELPVMEERAHLVGAIEQIPIIAVEPETPVRKVPKTGETVAAETVTEFNLEVTLEGTGQSKGDSPEVILGSSREEGELPGLGNEGLHIPTEGEMAIATSADLEGHMFPGNQNITMSSLELKNFIERVMISRLTGSWSLDAYKNMMSDCVKRSRDNKASIEEIIKNMAELGTLLKGMQTSIDDLKESCVCHDVITSKIRTDLDASVVIHKNLAEQVTTLDELVDGVTAEASSHKAELHRLGTEVISRWNKHEVDHAAVNARLSSLEELRRLDNIQRGREETAEMHHVKMEGFQMCLEMMIANGSFPRRLLGDPAFMDYVKDKDGLLIQIADRDKQFRTRAGSSQSKK